MKRVIDIQSVSFSYGSVPTLSGIDLQVAEGEFLGIVGPNAGGKSTLLKLILGLLQPQSGDLRVLERSPRAASRLLGYVPQYPSFRRDFPISVEQAVQLGRLGQGDSRKQALWPGRASSADHEAVRRALAEVEAGDIARRQIGSLSGGQLQRVLLARALVGHYVHSLGPMMLIATLLGAVLSITGLAVSYGPDLPAGPTIILLAGAAYIVSATVTQVFGRRRARLAAARSLSRGELRE